MGKTFYSHKFKNSGLQYEVGLTIATGYIIWINSPYECRKWNDVSIFRNSLLSMLGEGEGVEADDGYIGESPVFVKCPKSIGQNPLTDMMQTCVRMGQETVYK